MSIESLTNQIASIDRDIHSLQQQLHSIDSRLIAKRKEENGLLDRISKEKDLKRVVNLQHELARKTQETANIEKEKSNKQKAIHDKERKKYDLLQQRGKEEHREMEKTKEEHLELLKLQQEISRERNFHESYFQQLVLPNLPLIDRRTYDVFVSHASEDKDFVDPFVNALNEKGLSVWYDSTIMQVGMSLRRAIDKGLVNSRFGIVMLSQHFFKKEWPQKELDALFSKETEGTEVILPLWHNISKDQVQAHSRLLADKIALSTAQYTIAELADKIAVVVNE